MGVILCVSSVPGNLVTIVTVLQFWRKKCKLLQFFSFHEVIN